MCIHLYLHVCTHKHTPLFGYTHIRALSLSLSLFTSLSLSHTHTHTYIHAEFGGQTHNTHIHTHAQTHAQTHTHNTYTRVYVLTRHVSLRNLQNRHVSYETYSKHTHVQHIYTTYKQHTFKLDDEWYKFDVCLSFACASYMSMDMYACTVACVQICAYINIAYEYVCTYTSSIYVYATCVV